MRIAHRYLLGYLLLLALMAGALAWQVLAMHRMQSINRELSAAGFRAARVTLQLMRDRDLVEEYTRKAFQLGDADYVARLREFLEVFGEGMAELRALGDVGRASAERAALERQWQGLRAELEAALAALLPDTPQLPAGLEDGLDALRARLQQLYQAALAEIENQVLRSAETGRRAQQISWAAAALTLALGVVVSVLITRSIDRPLRELMAGTRAVSGGDFRARLDAGRQDEFADLARDFNAMARRLGELDQLKKDFVSYASHELKAPLASMQETSRLLLDRLPGPLNEKQQRLLRLNVESARRLSAMIANILDLSRLEAGALQCDVRKWNLADLARTALEEAAAEARDRELQLEAELDGEPFLAECDGDLIVQVLSNLLANAVKFSPSGGRVRLRVERAGRLPATLPLAWQDKLRKGGGWLRAVVLDNGPGVPREDRERIFEKFHQLGQGRKQRGQGVGLGLAICKGILEAHRGIVWVEENPEGGSCFQFFLPAPETAE